MIYTTIWYTKTPKNVYQNVVLSTETIYHFLVHTKKTIYHFVVHGRNRIPDYGTPGSIPQFGSRRRYCFYGFSSVRPFVSVPLGSGKVLFFGVQWTIFMHRFHVLFINFQASFFTIPWGFAPSVIEMRAFETICYFQNANHCHGCFGPPFFVACAWILILRPATTAAAELPLP